jgi:hypothetical protein
VSFFGFFGNLTNQREARKILLSDWLLIFERNFEIHLIGHFCKTDQNLVILENYIIIFDETFF